VRGEMAKREITDAGKRFTEAIHALDVAEGNVQDIKHQLAEEEKVRDQARAEMEEARSQLFELAPEAVPPGREL
jgi:predicted nuclease of restriction endonuclease-like RecB superfamily